TSAAAAPTRPTPRPASSDDLKARLKVTRFANYHASGKTALVGCVRIFRTFIMRRLRFQIAAVDRVAAYSCSIWPTTLFRRCAVVALPPRSEERRVGKECRS